MTSFFRRLYAVLLLAFLPLTVHAAASLVSTGRVVIVEYFHEPGCSQCFRVDSEIIPVIEQDYAGYVDIRRLDVTVEEHYVRLLSYMKKFDVENNERVYIVVDGVRILGGYTEISERLSQVIGERIEILLANSSFAAIPGAGDPISSDNADEKLEANFRTFTLVGVILAGLADGINPCAISTMVFLISVLSLSNTKGHHLLWVGVSFCLATFITYVTIGLGLLTVFHRLQYFHHIRRGVDLLLVLGLLVLSFYSVRDAFRFRRSGKASDIALRLPEGIKTRVHRIIRVGLGTRAQVTSAFVIGVVVTALESVCSGQLYLPTLALVVKKGIAVGPGLLYLLLFNVMFVVPLVAVFLLTYNGLKLTRLMTFSARTVFGTKLVMGLLFFTLAVLIFFLSGSAA